jgi:hypothetical protein
VGEYLIGIRARHERRTHFLAYLEDVKSKDVNEEVFQRHFGCGFDQLLEDWRSWVLHHENATYALPPPDVQDALIHRVIPMIQNSQAKAIERIQAVRAMGNAGFAIGADSLIGLLRDGSEIPKEELVWALEAISGMTFGDDADAWAAW